MYVSLEVFHDELIEKRELRRCTVLLFCLVSEPRRSNTNRTVSSRGTYTVQYRPGLAS